MTLSRGVAALLVSGAISAGLSLSISAVAEEPPAEPRVAEVVWDQRPETVAALADDATVLVKARVTGIEEGPDLVSQYPGDLSEEAIPTQRIVFETQDVLEGTIPASFKVFKTGASDLYLQGDPPYGVGETYVLFLDPQGEAGTWIPVAPDGRLEVDAQGEADPVIGGPVSEDLSGLTPEEIEAEADR